MENVKDTKEAKTRVVLINQIIDRAAELGIMYSSRLSHSMDINYAVQVFDIDLKAWLDSTNNDFIHDYVDNCELYLLPLTFKNIKKAEIVTSAAAFFGKMLKKYPVIKAYGGLLSSSAVSYTHLRAHET